MLQLLIILPLLASVFVLLAGNSGRFFSVFAGLCIILITFFAYYNTAIPQQGPIKGVLGFLSLKIDGISSAFILLTAFLTLICIFTSTEKPNGYFSLFFLLQSIVTALFCTTDLLSFYIFFELSLVPLFFVIGIWGGKNKIYAAYKFFLYTIFGSVGFLVAILFIYNQVGTLQIEKLYYQLQFLDFSTRKLLWLAIFFAFAVKVPMVPFHTWLPDAHVQAPTAGSVMLAGILIKLGGYGFLRILVPILPEASHYFAPLVLTLSTIAIVYTSIVAIMQTDIKKLIAYSSVAHMGIVTAGIFSFEFESIKGAVFQMISHGIVSGALFLSVGFLYKRTNTLQISAYNGIANTMPRFAFLFILFTMASIGLPGTSGFVGEFLVGLGLFHSHEIFAVICTTGVILSACYMLFLCKRVIWGAPGIHISDLALSESIALFILAALVIVLGLFPNFVLNIA